MKRFKNKKSVSTALSWEEKNPTDYTYRPSKAMIRLRKKGEEKKQEKQK